MSIDVDKNQRTNTSLTADEMGKYAGQWVARDMSGTTILAAGETIKEVRAKFLKENVDPGQTIMVYVPFPHEVVVQ